MLKERFEISIKNIIMQVKEGYLLQEGKGNNSSTWEGVLVSIQSSELFAVVTAQGVSGIALVGAQPQAVTLTLRL